MDPSAQRIRDMFSAIAGRYDLLNRILSLGMDRGWRRKAVRALALDDGARFLDVCGGTGDLAAAFLRRDPRGRVLLVDFSEPMLRIARARGLRWGDRFQAVLGDALSLPVPDGSCDALGCAFGVRNLVDVRGGLEEFHRVLRPGGALCILEFSPREAGLAGRAVAWYVRRAVPAIGRLVASRPDAYRYLSGSAASFHGPEELTQMIRGAGFIEISQRPFSFGGCTLFTAVRNPRS